MLRATILTHHTRVYKNMEWNEFYTFFSHVIRDDKTLRVKIAYHLTACPLLIYIFIYIRAYDVEMSMDRVNKYGKYTFCEQYKSKKNYNSLLKI